MKSKIFLLLLISISSLKIYSQSFEGKLIYNNTYKSHTQKMSDQQWLKMMGDTQEYYIKGGNYKSIINGTLLQWQLYLNSDNKLYTKMSNSESAIWNDGSVNKDSVISSKLNKNVTTILGYRCDELILTTKSGNQKYYFNSSLKVDVDLYKNHKFGNWYAFLKQSKSLPLKIVTTNSNFTMISTVSEIEKMKIKDTSLKLPKGIQVEKSPY